MELTDFSTARLSGTITCARDGLLYTSIPQNGNWHVYVDGKEAETVLVGEAMTAVYLEEGYHEVIFRYRNPAFTLGCVISLLSTGVLAGLYFWIYHARKKKGKYQK